MPYFHQIPKNFEHQTASFLMRSPRLLARAFRGAYPQQQQFPTHAQAQLNHRNSKQTLDGILLNAVTLYFLDTKLLSCLYVSLNLDKTP